MPRDTVSLAMRWNSAAAEAGFAGSEFFDEPENVFRRVRENQDMRFQYAMLRNVARQLSDALRATRGLLELHCGNTDDIANSAIDMADKAQAAHKALEVRNA